MSLEEDIVQKKFRSEYHKLVVNILYTNSWLSGQQLKIFRQFDITAAQYNVLRILRGRNSEPATINLIIERMIDKMSNASRIVDKLVAKELATRVVSREDRRVVHVHITQKGLELLTEMDPLLESWENNLEVLSVEEATQLNNLLDKLRSSGK
jgi:DNA-binding MarR family transcriptional regulator